MDAIQPRRRPEDLAEHLREPTASTRALEDAEDATAAHDWRAREARGETTYIPLPEVHHRLGLSH